MFSPLSRTAIAVASFKARAKRRKQRVQRWGERLKLVGLSSALRESAILQSVVGMFRMSADGTHMLRASSGSQFVGAGYRHLRMEILEGRQMLSATTIDLATASDSVSPNTVLPGTDTDDLTKINIPVFQGTAEPNATIEVFDGTHPTPIATATANELGNWVTSPLAIALPDDVHSITAKATDGLGNMSTSSPLLVTIDTIVTINTAPGMTTGSDSGSSSTDNITNVNTPTFAGMTEDDAPRNA
jgi:large repetitive protein